MDVTTVKVHKRTKAALDKLKDEKESYDEIISSLIEHKLGKNLRGDMVEGYTKVGSEELELLSEWEAGSGEME